MKLFITMSDFEKGVGRFELENGLWIAYGGGFAPKIMPAFLADNFADQGAQDLRDAEAILVYVGMSGIRQPMDLIRSLATAGKRVIMVGCDCMYPTKQIFAKELGIPLIMRWQCGSIGFLTSIIEGEIPLPA